MSVGKKFLLTVFQSLAILVYLFSCKGRRHPGAAANVVVDVRYLWEHCRDNLNATGSITNDRYAFVLVKRLGKLS